MIQHIIHMKKLFKILLIVLLLSPALASANIAVSWNATSTAIGYIMPTAVNGNTPYIKVPQIGVSTSSPFASLSITGLSGISPFAISTSSDSATALRVSAAGNLHFSNGAGIDIGNGTTPPPNGLISLGNIGIGTTSPKSSLSVGGNAMIYESGSTVAVPLTVVNNTSTAAQDTELIQDYTNFAYSGNLLHINVQNNTDTATGIRIDNVGTGNSLIVNGGNTGLGTTSPYALLSVGNTNGIGFTTATSTFNSTGGININSGCFAVGNVCVGSGAGTVSAGLQGQNAFYNANGTIISATSTIFITQAGLVGIATTSPYGQFSINSPAGVPAFVVGSSTKTNFIVDKNGNVVVGGTSPTNVNDPLEVQYNNNNNLIGAISIDTTAPSSGQAAITFKVNGTREAAMAGDASGNISFNGASTGETDFNFSSGSGGQGFWNGSGGLYMKITSTGTVGIATSTPQAQLAIVTSQNTGGIYIAAQANNPAALLQMSTSSNIGGVQATNTVALWNSKGNLGLGTTSPFATLSDVASGIAPLAVSTSTSGTNLEVDANGHIIYGGPTPTVTGGTSSIVSPSNDNAGQISVVGTALTSVTLTFARPFATAPICTESDNQLVVAADIVSISTTQVVFGFGTGGVSSATIWYNCGGTQ